MIDQAEAKREQQRQVARTMIDLGVLASNGEKVIESLAALSAEERAGFLAELRTKLAAVSRETRPRRPLRSTS